jgi:hypothetical protein
MKRILRILVLTVALVTGLSTVSAQTVQVIVTQKAPVLPTAATNYLDDPFRYFNVQFVVIGAGSEGLDVFYDMEFSVNTNTDYYFRTKPGSIPKECIHLHDGVNIMKRDELMTQLRNKRLETNIFTDPLNAMQMPEGTYELCMDIYLWSDRTNPARVPISVGPCPTFEMCYSGSAPELVSPLAGAQLDLNGAMVVIPTRKVNFFWTPVISNCSNNSTRFKYQLKVVKVLNGQNYLDAIRFNPTVFSTEVRNGTFAVFDTLVDIKVHMERGALYVAQVQAEQIKTGRSMENFNIANDGKSQPMPFFWDYPKKTDGYTYGMDDAFNTTFQNTSWTKSYSKGKSRKYGYVVDDESEEGEEDEGIAGLTIWEGGVEEVSELETIIDEMEGQDFVGFSPNRYYVESDGYYTIPMTEDLEVTFTPVRHESLKDVSYTIELYDYIEGDVDSITSYEPQLYEKIELPESQDMDSRELINHTLAGWGTAMDQGSLYYLQLSSHFTVDYWDYLIADTNFYVNGMLAEHVHDTVSRDFMEEELVYSNGVYFQWGDDPEAPASMTPQWKAPVDRTGDDIHDPKNYELPASVPEVQKVNTFPISWVPVKNVADGDHVDYEVNVYELKSDQTLEEAVSENEALVSRTVTDVNKISESDTKFFKVFSSGKTYVMTLSIIVYGESDVTYHFENGVEAIPVVFKVK